MKDCSSEESARRKVEKDGTSKAGEEKRYAAQEGLCGDDGYEMAPELRASSVHR